MSKEESSLSSDINPIATISDILCPIRVEIVYIKSLNKSVKIKSLVMDDLISINVNMSKLSGLKDDNFTFVKGIVFKGLVEPALTLEQAGQLNSIVAAEIARHIFKLSGMDKESVGLIEDL